VADLDASTLPLVFVALPALQSLHLLKEGRSASEIAVGLLVHSLPAVALLAAAAAAWRWPWVGALGLVVFAAAWRREPQDFCRLSYC
jgi:hypothetical protein